MWSIHWLVNRIFIFCLWSLEGKVQEEKIPHLDVSSQWFRLRFNTYSCRRSSAHVLGASDFCGSRPLGESEPLLEEDSANII
jgi:hypothetical protein